MCAGAFRVRWMPTTLMNPERSRALGAKSWALLVLAWLSGTTGCSNPGAGGESGITAMENSLKPSAPPPERKMIEARALAGEYQKRLKAALEDAIAAGGAARAVDVCRIQAKEIAQALQEESGWIIGRVSSKPRNPLNAPDAWEQQILAGFAAQRREQVQGPLEVSRVEQGRLRYMRAIDTGPVCLACHGAKLDPKVQARIASAYPQDQATGYSLGDLRGAFSFETSETGSRPAQPGY
jgi:hypothetical protein